jgi:diguanylate cyclase (GGDEF)-like protein/PAS domain S-box-containing protein
MPSLLPSRRHARVAVELPLAALAEYPGAAVLVADDGAIGAVRGTAAALVEQLRRDGLDAALAAAAAAAIRHGAAAIELFERPEGQGSLEAVLLPLGSGREALALLRPVDLDPLLRRRLVESRQRYKDLAGLAGDFSWETDAEGSFTFVSPGGALDWSAHELIGRAAAGLVTGPEAGDASAFSARRRVRDAELSFRKADGGEEWLRVHAAPVLGDGGEWLGARGLCRRITAERGREHDSAARAMQDRLVAHLMRTMSAEEDPAQALRAALASTGLAIGAAGGAAFRRGAVGEAVAVAEWGSAAGAAVEPLALALLAPSGAVPSGAGDAAILAAATRSGALANGVVILWCEAAGGGFSAEDRMTFDAAIELFGAALERLGRHEQSLAAARTDPLTGLLNRRGFAEEAARRLARCAAARAPATLAYIDLDHFKLVNDVRGHAAGDDALAAIGRILRGNLRGGDLVARLGGDEFVLWLDGIGEETAKERLARIVAECGGLAALTDDAARPFGVSLGLAAWRPERPETLEALMTRADAAMYAAKRRGGGAVGVAPAPGAADAGACP